MTRRLAALLALGLLVPSQAAAATAQWTLDPQPEPVRRSSATLIDVDTRSARDAWAVGHHTVTSGQAGVIEHWDGARWRLAASPFFDATTTLRAVSAAAADDAWAVGYTEPESFPDPYLTVAMHYDGTRWQRVPTPNRAGANANNLYGVAAAPDGTAIAVGSTSSDAFSTTDTLIVRWNGERWRTMRSPSPNPFFNELVDVGIDATGRAYALCTDAGASYVLRRGARRWRVLPRPPAPGRAAFYTAIAVLRGGDVIAVGGFQTLADASPVRPLVARWDGEAWRRIRATNERSESFFDDVTVARGTAYAVGTALTENGDASPLVERSTGGRFTPMAVPEGVGGALVGVSATGAERALAIGNSEADVPGPISLRLG